MAEVQARRQAADRGLTAIGVSSAGTAAHEGAAASEMAVRVAAYKGLDLTDHQARALTSERVRVSDLVITMTRRHSDAVRRLIPDARVIRATEFLPGDHQLHGADVPDPFGSDRDAYAATWEILQECIDALFDLLSAGSESDFTRGIADA